MQRFHVVYSITRPWKYLRKTPQSFTCLQQRHFYQKIKSSPFWILMDKTSWFLRKSVKFGIYLGLGVIAWSAIKGLMFPHNVRIFFFDVK
jgi:hypothetical protein